MSTLVIASSYAGAGRGPQRLLAALGDDAPDVVLAHLPGEAWRLAAAAASFDTVVAAGGDGTVHEVVNGLMALPPPRPRLALVPLGTGNDIARNLGVTDAAAGWAAVRGGHAVALDLLHITCRERAAWGVLNCGVGFGGEVVARATPRLKRLAGPNLTYLLATLSALAAWDSPWVSVCSEAGCFRGAALFVALGNGEFEGGGTMRLSPGASMSDGVAHLTIIRRGLKLHTVAHVSDLSSGRHLAQPEVAYHETRWMEVRAARPLRVQSDGDVIGTTPCRVRVVPGALEVCTPWPSR
jgi:diacylglycerol kinase (ATP)